MNLTTPSPDCPAIAGTMPPAGARLHLLDAAGTLGRTLARDVSGLSWPTIEALQELQHRFRQLVELECSPAPAGGAIARAERDCIEVTTQLLALVHDPTEGLASLPQDARDAAAVLTAQLKRAGLLEANQHTTRRTS